jgi:hypothetical protein
MVWQRLSGEGPERSGFSRCHDHDTSRQLGADAAHMFATNSAQALFEQVFGSSEGAVPTPAGCARKFRRGACIVANWTAARRRSSRTFAYRDSGGGGRLPFFFILSGSALLKVRGADLT